MILFEKEMKIAVGVGGYRGALVREQNWCVERQSRLQAAGQLGSEAAKRNLIREFVKLFSLLTKRNFLFSRPYGERLEFVSELE